MKKILFIIIYIIIIPLNIINYVNAEGEDECFSYSSKTWFSLYEERVRCLCEKYEPEKALIIIEDKFEEIENRYDLIDIKKIHQTNMNNIYKCWILSIQKKSFELTKKILIKPNPDLKDRLEQKIDEKISLIWLSLVKLKCNEFNEKNSILKLNVLKQVTYETCKYVNYLEYLKEKNTIIANIAPEDKDEYAINEIYEIENRYNKAIDEEIKHVYKIFPLAFHAYTEYENNVVIHLLLEVIKEDYIVIREKLHQVLNPINQVVYKISNAMRK